MYFLWYGGYYGMVGIVLWYGGYYGYSWVLWVSLHTFFTKNVYRPYVSSYQEGIHHYTAHKYSTETAIMLPDSSANLIIAIPRNCSLSISVEVDC